MLNTRGNRGLLMVLGHLKAGVTPAQAVADLNSIGADLEKSYPKDDGHDLYPDASRSNRRLVGRSGTGIPYGIDAAGGIDSSGRMRQLGQPVCCAPLTVPGK